MRKYLYILFILFYTLSSQILEASIIEQISYVPDKCDIHIYLNLKNIITFLNNKGVNITELDEIAVDDSSADKDKMIKELSVKLSDINEMLFSGNSESIEKKRGFIVLLSVKEGTGRISETIKKKPVKIKKITFYKIEDEEGVLISKLDDFFIVGSTDYIEAFLDKRMLNKNELNPATGEFVKNSENKAFYFRLSISKYLKDTIDKAFVQGSMIFNGLNDNLFIKALLNLQSVEYGMQINNKIYFSSEMKGLSLDDSEKLLMLSHFVIVGSSLATTFSDFISAKNEERTFEQVTKNKELISSMQQIFGRIKTKQIENGVQISFYMTDKDTDSIVSFINKSIAEQKKARIDKYESERISVITKAISENDIAVAERLIKEKIDINHHDLNGNTLLSTAALAGNINLVTLLISKGADVNQKNSDGLTSLHNAAIKGSLEIASILIKNGAEVNVKSEDDMTPLHFNSSQGNAKLTELLINAGADVNAISLNGSAAVHIASAEGHLDVIKALAGKNADFNIRDANQERGVDIAARLSHNAIVDYFKQKYNLVPEQVVNDDLIDNYDDSSEDGESGDYNMN